MMCVFVMPIQLLCNQCVPVCFIVSCTAHTTLPYSGTFQGGHSARWAVKGTRRVLYRETLIRIYSQCCVCTVHDHTLLHDT